MLFTTRVQKAALLPAKSEARYSTIKEIKPKIQSITSDIVGFLVGMTNDSSSEFKKALAQIENTIAYLAELPSKFVQSGAFSEYEILIAESVARIKEVTSESSIVIGDSEASLDLANEFPAIYVNLANQIQGAIVTSTDNTLKYQLSDRRRSIGGLIMRFIEALRNGDDSKLTQSSRSLNAGVNDLIENLKLGSRGFLQCKKAAQSLETILQELNGSLELVSVGKLNSITTDDTFQNHRESILAAVQRLSDSVGGFVSIQSLSQADIERLASQALQNIQALNREGIQGATTSIDRSVQQDLLNAVKNVTLSLQDIMNQSVIVRDMTDSQSPRVKAFYDAINRQKAASNQLLLTVKAASESESAYLKALDGVIASVAELQTKYQSADSEFGLEKPSDILVLIHALELNLVKVLDAKPLEEKELVVALNATKMKLDALLVAIKSCLSSAPIQVKENTDNLVLNTSNLVLETLNAFKHHRLYSSEESLVELQHKRSAFEDGIAELANGITKLDPDGYADQTDPNVMNEQDLANIATDLELVSRHLKASQDSVPAPIASTETLEVAFDSLLYKSAKDVAIAASALLKASISTQREIIARGRKLPPAEAMYFSDGTWSEGIVSAAKDVGAYTKEVCQMAQAPKDEDSNLLRIVATTKQISASTVQILTASSVHTDSFSKSQLILNSTAKQLMSANDALIKLCEDHLTDERIEGFQHSKSKTAHHAEEIDAQLSILQIEKQLEKARLKLAAVRKFRYSVSKENPGAPQMEKDASHSAFGQRVRRSSIESVARSLADADEETRMNVLDMAKRFNEQKDQSPLKPADSTSVIGFRKTTQTDNNLLGLFSRKSVDVTTQGTSESRASKRNFSISSNGPRSSIIVPRSVLESKTKRVSTSPGKVEKVLSPVVEMEKIEEA